MQKRSYNIPNRNGTNTLPLVFVESFKHFHQECLKTLTLPDKKWLYFLTAFWCFFQEFMVKMFAFYTNTKGNLIVPLVFEIFCQHSA